MKVYYDEKIDSQLIKNENIAILGYGSQGHAHALNLHESGANVVVGLREDSPSWAKAKTAGLQVMTTEKAAQWADFVMILVPDEQQKHVYHTQIEPHLKKGATLAFAHGFNIHFDLIEPRSDLDVVMIAPKGPGHLVRSTYQAGGGVPGLVAIHHDSSGHALEKALSYACAIGCSRSGVIQTNFKEETETDLFGEQAVLCGGATALVEAGFETLVEAGYAPEMAYFECLHELKLIVDLMYEGGIANMRYSVSNTAEYGDVTRGNRIINAQSKTAMKEILSEIQSGKFAKEFIADCENGKPTLIKSREQAQKHPLETVGKKLRAMMPWIKQNAIVDKSKN